MNKCNKCGHLFIVPATETIMHYEVDTRREETFPVCPECGSDHFQEATLCPACRNNWAPLDFCDNCLADVSDAVMELAEQKGMAFKLAVELVSAWVEDSHVDL